jgi:BirA family biotin operon repressor/biotin-[acetyl-CoA-carboxylase] ligase
LKIIKIDSVNSTNSYLSDLIIKNEISETTVFYTLSQTHGRGLGTNTWKSEDNKNLVFSLGFFQKIKVDQHFVLSIVVSLAICDYLHLKGIRAKIKWPNDIYFQNKKLAGILIDNTICGDVINHSIIGVGLNLNQRDFAIEIPNPVSLSQITGKIYNIDKEVKIISKIILEKLNDFKNIDFSVIHTKYLNNLYRYQTESVFKTPTKTFKGKIIDVKKDGFIVISDKELKTHEFYFKEVELVI